MNMHVQGFKTPDDKWKEMKVVWDACEAAAISPPEEVSEYFEQDEPDQRGVEVKLEGTDCCSEWQDDCRSGFEVDVKKLPAHVTHIQFYNSY